MENRRIKIVLILNYFVLAILLNSVGTVILKVQENFNISKAQASTLEGFKDLPIAICSFLIASFLPRIGIKNAMLIALSLVSIMCFIMPFTNAFWFFKLLFATAGVSFALIKISVFTSIGLITKSEREHISFMGFLEGFFMTGVLLGNLLFSVFINDNDPQSLSWLRVYWVLGSLSLLSFIFLFFSPLNEEGSRKQNTSFVEDLKNSAQLITRKKVLLFLSCAFLFVLVEQSFQTWTPTFYREVLHVPTSMSVQAAAVLAGAFALGRFLSGFFTKKIQWLTVVSICILLFASCILLVIPLTQGQTPGKNIHWLNAPLIVYVFPLMGVFLAPIYPSINSVILASIPKFLHSSMSGLIVIFSAIGGTIGSIITGFLFQEFSGQQAFYMSLIPLTFLLISSIALYRTPYK